MSIVTGSQRNPGPVVGKGVCMDWLRASARQQVTRTERDFHMTATARECEDKKVYLNSAYTLVYGRHRDSGGCV